MSSTLTHLDQTQKHMLGLVTQLMSWYNLSLDDVNQSVYEYETMYGFPTYAQCESGYEPVHTYETLSHLDTHNGDTEEADQQDDDSDQLFQSESSEDVVLMEDDGYLDETESRDSIFVCDDDVETSFDRFREEETRTLIERNQLQALSSPIPIAYKNNRRRSWGSYSDDLDCVSCVPPRGTDEFSLVSSECRSAKKSTSAPKNTTIISPSIKPSPKQKHSMKPSTWICTRRDFRDRLNSGIKICPDYSTCNNAACKNFHIEDQFICKHATNDNYCPEDGCDKIVIKKCRKGMKCKDNTCSYRHV
jgi:hypothetical protein